MKFQSLLAILEKEMKLELRFKLSFISSALLDPLINTLVFCVIYFGFFSFGAQQLGKITKEEFVLFLILGGLANAFFSLGFGAFGYKLLYEKFWHTIEAFLITPVSMFNLLIGLGLVEFFRIFAGLILFMVLCFIIKSVSWTVLVLVPLILICILMGSLGVGLIKGIFVLTNENVVPAFNILYWGLGFLSCFYYPIDILPKFIHVFVIINPVYHALALIRHLWFGYPVPSVLFSVLYVVGFAVFMPIIGVYLFNRLWARSGLQGY